MFNLLLSETYRNEKNIDIQLEKEEISMLLTVMVQFVRYCTKELTNGRDKQERQYEKIL